MARQSFGRTVRYRRTKLGLSQTRLAELVGRSAATIRAWEADRSVPKDPQVLTALSAVLGVDEQVLHEKAGVPYEPGPAVETSPTIEQALATIAPGGVVEETSPTMEVVAESLADETEETEDTDGEPETPPRRLRAVPRPAQTRPVAEPTTTTTSPVLVREASYLEDPAQRQFYKIRTLGSVIALIVFALALLWAMSRGLESLASWWNDFFSLLRL